MVKAFLTSRGWPFNRRRNTGSNLVEGVAGMVLVIFACVGAVLLLVNSFMASYYKGKVAFVTQQAANYAANEMASPFGLNNADVIETVDALCHYMSLPIPASVNVAVSSDKNKQYVTVSANVVGLKLFGNGSLLPTVIAMSDSATAVVDDTKPKYTCQISMCQNNGTGGQGYGGVALVPCYFEMGFNGPAINNVLEPSRLPACFATLGVSGDAVYTSILDDKGTALASRVENPPCGFASTQSCLAGAGITASQFLDANQYVHNAFVPLVH